MTRKEFLKAIALALNPEFEPIPYLSLDCFHGCALDNKRRIVTMEQVASLIAGHCITFNGSFLSDEANQLAELAKRFDIANGAA